MILTLLFLISGQLFAQGYTYQFAFKAGGSVGMTHLSTLEQENEVAPSAGFNLHFGYRWRRYELNASSYVSVSKITEQKFHVHGSDIRARGIYRSVNFGPVSRFYLKEVYKDRRPYFALGPLIGLSSFKFKKGEVVGGNFGFTHKITYETFGGVFAFGVEEIYSKEDHPSFLEVSIRYAKSFLRTEVGGTKKEVDSIIKEKDKGTVDEVTLMISLGVLIF